MADMHIQVEILKVLIDRPVNHLDLTSKTLTT